jgi:uncharacterized protein
MPPASRPQHLAPHRRERARRRARPAVHASREGTPRPAARISLWRTPRTRSLLALGVLAAVAALVALAARVYTDVLWFHELGQERVLWTTLKWKILARGVPGLGTACFVLLNFAVAERVLARLAAARRPHRVLAYPAVAIAAGVVSGAWRADGAWRLLALWSGRGAFGTHDPLFHRDVGYFVFSLPLYQQAARWALDTVVIAAVATVAAYWLAGGLRRSRAHLLTLAAVAVAAEGALPAAIERLDVEPQALSRETPYLADAIAGTRSAFGLADVRVRRLRAGERLSADALAANRRTIDNVPLWDTAVLRPSLNDLQAIGRYYSFPTSTVDRYVVDGEPRLLTLAARQLDRTRLTRDARSWANDRFAYTHGYGVVAVRAGAVARGGHPRFAQSEFLSRHGPLRLRQPRIYFGSAPERDPPYVGVTTHRGEIDRPIPGSRAPEYHYDGGGGIALSGLFRRAAFAARFGDLKLLLTETVTDRSRIVIHRDAGERLRALAPFLRWDRHAQTVIAGGRVQYLFHGYTTSTHYPYSAMVRLGEDRVNYARASAQAVVDAFSGRVTIYAVDAADPILRAWRAAYPGLLRPASEMPANLREHLRYPQTLFKAQARAYATYHASNPTGFWNSADAWQLPLQLAGPVEGAGEIHFPDPQESVDGDEDELPARWRMRPDYLFARLPGDARERLMLVTPYTPRGRQNLAAYLAGTIERDGTLRLTLLSLPRDRLTIGPTQATRRILASPGISRRLELLNRESRDLGRGAVNRTILGDVRLVPIGSTLVHVQPIYLVAGGSGLPRLQLVTAYADGRVGYGRDLEAALRRVVRP